MAEIEDTRALLHSGYPDALTVDPADLEALRRHDQIESTRMFATAYTVLAFFVVYGMLALGVCMLR